MKTSKNSRKNPAIGKTAATTNHLIERVNGRRVDLCESQGDRWVTIQRGIDLDTAVAAGFNRHGLGVEEVFAGLV